MPDKNLFLATSSCPSLGCEYKCQASLTGGTCSCPQGRMVSADNRTCVDRNECTEWGHCDQLCTNTEGGYICSCATGYNLLERSKCVAPNASDMIIYFAWEKTVYKMNSRGEGVKIVANTTGASGLDFHYDKNLLFWSDIKTRKVHSQQLRPYSSAISELPSQEITLPGTWSPVAIAIDWIGDKLYVADSVGQKIDVFELDGRWHAVVLGSNLTSPADIAVDSTSGLMFVADSSQVSIRLLLSN